MYIILEPINHHQLQYANIYRQKSWIGGILLYRNSILCIVTFLIILGRMLSMPRACSGEDFKKKQLEGFRYLNVNTNSPRWTCACGRPEKRRI